MNDIVRLIAKIITKSKPIKELKANLQSTYSIQTARRIHNVEKIILNKKKTRNAREKEREADKRYKRLVKTKLK